MEMFVRQIEDEDEDKDCQIKWWTCNPAELKRLLLHSELHTPL